MTWLDRKQQRREHFQRFVHGWKLRPCMACNGSGRYDHNGSPPCGGCDGTGKERYKPAQAADLAAVKKG
jgi:DnaJ-class molecular chaperone